MNLQNINHLVHAYKIAPWRIQRQWIGNILLAVVALAMIAALYLDVSAQAAIAGREIQDLTAGIAASQQASADLQTELAVLTSASVMAERAKAIGYHEIESNAVEYLVVPGYSAPQPQIVAVAPQPQLSAPKIIPEYTQSLLDWFAESISLSPRGLR